MTRVFCFFAIIGVFSLSFISFIPVYSAGQCDFGSAYAWFKASGDTWMHATVHPLLRRGESFEIQVVVTSTTNLRLVFVKLHEFGTPVYEVLEGPTAMEELLVCQDLSVAGQSSVFFWKLKVRDDTSWVNGYAPLEVFVQFNKNDTAVSCIHFDVITAFIIDEPWVNVIEEHMDKDYPSTEIRRSLSAVNIAGVLMICLLFIIVLRVQQQNR